jgi:hypothetical protein
MAKREIRVCDICLQVDGEGDSPEAIAVETITVTVDGKPALLDVCEGHKREYERIQETLASFESAATIVTEPPNGRPKRTQEGTKENVAIRTWARGQGIEISDRGRISDELRAQYLAAVANGEVTPAEPVAI